MNLAGLPGELLTNSRALAGAPRAHGAPLPAVSWAPGARPPEEHRAQVVAIGASTGGPPALQAIIPLLPKELEAVVLVVQHIPAGFTPSLANRLDQRSLLPVREARAGEAGMPGRGLIPPPGLHLNLPSRGSGLKTLSHSHPP